MIYLYVIVYNYANLALVPTRLIFYSVEFEHFMPYPNYRFIEKKKNY